MKSQKDILQKSQKLLTSRARSLAGTKANMAVTYPAIETEWIAAEHSEQSSIGEQFVIFDKLTFPISMHFFTQANLCF